MISQPKVSIIVPVHNTSQYLRKCMDSLVDQSLKDIEIICVNDASTDDSLKILRDYEQKDDRIKVINLEQNVGQGGARNIGLNIAKASFVGFVDSDDFVSLQMYETLYNKIIMSEGDIAVGDFYKYYTDDNCILEKNGNEDVFSLPYDERNRNIILRPFRMWTNLYKKKLFIDNNLLFPEKVLYEDNAIIPVVYVLANKIVKVNSPIYYYRCSNYSTTRSKNNYNYFDRLTTADILLSNFKEKSFYSKYRNEIDAYYTRIYYVGTLIGSLTMFDTCPIYRIKFFMDSFKRTIPNFKSNKYYDNISWQLRAVVRMSEINIPITYLIVKYLAKIKNIVYKIFAARVFQNSNI